MRSCLNRSPGLQVGLGFEAGLAIVIIAIVLDRMTQNLGKTKTAPSGGNRKKKFPVRKWMSVVAILVFLGMVIAAYADFGGGKEKVTLAYVSWESEIASTNVVKKVLEKQGFEVDLVETQATPMWQGVAQGDVDAHVAGWFPVTSKVIADQFKGQYVDLRQFGRSAGRTGGSFVCQSQFNYRAESI